MTFLPPFSSSRCMCIQLRGVNDASCTNLHAFFQYALRDVFTQKNSRASHHPATFCFTFLKATCSRHSFLWYCIIRKGKSQYVLYFFHRIYGGMSIHFSYTVKSLAAVYRIWLCLSFKAECAVLYLLDSAGKIRARS